MMRIIGVLMMALSALLVVWEGYVYMNAAADMAVSVLSVVKIVFGFVGLLIGYVLVQAGKKERAA